MENQDIVLPVDYPRRRHPYSVNSSFVYFIYGAGRIKIGYSSDVERRLSEIATSNAFRPVLLLTFEGSIEAEREVHAKFAEDRVHLEWFRLSDPLRRYLVKRLDADTLTALRKAEDEFRDSFLPVEEAPRKWKKPPKRCSHGNPLSRSCAKCTKEADMRVYDALVKKMQAEDY